MRRTMRRLSASFLPLLFLALPCPATAHAQDVACAVGAPVPDADREAPVTAQQELHNLATGVGVKVAVIDTGVARHPQLNQLAGGADFVTPDTPEPFKDCDAHGTVVAGIIAGTQTGIAPGAIGGRDSGRG